MTLMNHIRQINSKSLIMNAYPPQRKMQPHSPTSRLLKEIQSLDSCLHANQHFHGMNIDMIDFIQEIPKQYYSIEDVEDEIIGEDSLFGEVSRDENKGNSIKQNQMIAGKDKINVNISKNSTNANKINLGEGNKLTYSNKTTSLRQKNNQNINNSNALKNSMHSKRNSISPTMSSAQNQRLSSTKIAKQSRLATQPNSHQLFQHYLEEENARERDEKCKKGKYCSRGSDISSLQCTFKPKILKKSYQLAKNIKPIVQRSSIQPELKNKRLPYKQLPKNIQKHSFQRIQQLSKPRLIQKVSQPPIEQNQEKPLSKKSLSSSTLDIAARNKIWMQQKQAKIERLRMQEEQQKIRKEQCTHTPTILQYKGKSNAMISNFGKEGIINYFERMVQRKASVINFHKDNSLLQKQGNSLKDNHSLKDNACIKKQSYEEAVRQLHSKIMRMNIG